MQNIKKFLLKEEIRQKIKQIVNNQIPKNIFLILSSKFRFQLNMLVIFFN